MLCLTIQIWDPNFGYRPTKAVLWWIVVEYLTFNVPEILRLIQQTGLLCAYVELDGWTVPLPENLSFRYRNPLALER